MSPAGRPPTRGKTSVDRMLRVRLTEDEWNELEARTQQTVQTMSEYVREKMFAGKWLTKGKAKS